MIFFILKKLIFVLRQKINYLYIKDINISRIDALSGDEFENYLYYLFSYMGFNVKKTPKTRDFGADLIIKYKETIPDKIEKLTEKINLLESFMSIMK